MGISLDKSGSPPSPTLGSFQHLILRRHRVLFFACCLLLAFTSIYTVFAVASDFTVHRGAPAELRPVALGKASNGRVRSLIPPKIWQIMLPKGGKKADLYNVDPEQLKETNTWLAKNIDYQYHLVGPRTADEFVEANFASNERLINAYHNLTNMGMKSDLLRYLILSVEGGVYSDIDTVAIRPVDSWIPRYLRGRVRLVVGIEFDKRDGPNWADIPHDLQFCQWTIAAAPGHPVFMRMVDRILDSLDELSEKHGVPISEITPGSFEVMNSTGPAAWTDVVFETLQGFDPSLNETKDLSFMEKARVFGDILVLTIDGFGMGQVHSASTNDGTIPPTALIKHQFWGSWREPAPQKEEEQKEEAPPKDEEKSSNDAAQEQRKEESQRLKEEAQRMQEAQRLEEEATRLKEGAEKLAEEAMRQKEEAMKTAGGQDSHDNDHGHDHDHAHDHDQDHHHDNTTPVPVTHPASQSPAPKVPVPEPSPPVDGESEVIYHEDEEHFRKGDVLKVAVSSPAAPNGNEDEVLQVDTGTPPWPGQEWAP